MSTISASTTSTTAYKVTADTTGTLVLQTGASPTTAVTIDSSQNVGIGAVPTGFPSGGTLTFPADKAITSAGNGLTIGNNWYYNSGDKFAGTGYATQYYQYSGTHRWSVSSASGSAGGAVTFNEAMRIDSSGNLGIGTSSPSVNLEVTGGSAPNIKVSSTSNVYTYLTMNAWALDRAQLRAEGASGGGSGSGGGVLSLWTANSSGTMTERARIDSSGHFLVGATNNSQTAGVGIKLLTESTSPTIDIVLNTPNNNTPYILYNTNATYNGYRWYVKVDGGIANFSGNNSNLSDERTKTNIELAGGYLEKICGIPVKLFNYKDEQEGEQRTLGVIAQDVEAVAPELVDVSGFGETPEDGIPLKSIYTTDMMFALMKCIQELKTELDAAKADIATLKGAA